MVFFDVVCVILYFCCLMMVVLYVLLMVMVVFDFGCVTSFFETFVVISATVVIADLFVFVFVDVIEVVFVDMFFVIYLCKCVFLIVFLLFVIV